MKNIEDYKEYIIEEYVNKQKTALEISKEIDFHNSTISRALHKWGVSRGQKSQKRLEITPFVIEDFTIHKMYCEDIAKKYQVDSHTIYRILDEAGIARQTGYHSKCNIDYFETIDSPNKAYLLGFITADGAVVNYCLSIEVKENDRELVEFAQQEINPHAAISECHYKMVNQLASNNKIYSYTKNNIRVAFGAKKIGKDLEKYGIVQNKSKTITRVPIEYISRDLLPFYFRGLIDGDGCVHKDGKVSIYSGSKPFLEDVQRILVEETGVSKLQIYHGTSYFLTWSSKQDKKKLFHYLYSDLDATFYYKRKYNRLLENISEYDNTEVTS